MKHITIHNIIIEEVVDQIGLRILIFPKGTENWATLEENSKDFRRQLSSGGIKNKIVYSYEHEATMTIYKAGANNEFELIDSCTFEAFSTQGNSNKFSKNGIFEVSFKIESKEELVMDSVDYSQVTLIVESLRDTQPHLEIENEERIFLKFFDKTQSNQAYLTPKRTFPKRLSFNSCYKFKKNTPSLTLNLKLNTKDIFHIEFWVMKNDKNEEKTIKIGQISLPKNGSRDQIIKKSKNFEVLKEHSRKYEVSFILESKTPISSLISHHSVIPELSAFTSIRLKFQPKDIYSKLEKELDETKTNILINDYDSLEPLEGFKDLFQEINPENNEEYKRINEFISAYYTTFLEDIEQQKDYIKELLHTQYPVMAFPVYPEPVYYYLKEYSQKYILPAVEDLPMNSIALFVNNPEFIEAFLCGMNTEMGRELLWREYPTDSRGSYFRKFWDTEDKKSIQELVKANALFDVKPIHQWINENTSTSSAKLGYNHLPGKDDLLIFAIKGELLRKYPETAIYLNSAKLDGDKIHIDPNGSKVLPDLAAWINEETYIVGFPLRLEDIAGSPKKEDNDYGYFLTFMNRPSETRFMHITFASNKNLKDESHAGLRASNTLDRPYIYGKHISQFLSVWQ